ncbi:hypothetical protein Tco_1081790 [Tanacetum coccineum]|uniref:Uncharacterized protein n=1 Tax=Tanacetum coccineum TaxID=301880 RepID=A0ABQ5HYX1_9ASTR
MVVTVKPNAPFDVVEVVWCDGGGVRIVLVMMWCLLDDGVGVASVVVIVVEMLDGSGGDEVMMDRWCGEWRSAPAVVAENLTRKSDGARNLSVCARV